MTHYSEHTLDLYVRNSGQVEHERAVIESHLTECAGCRAIADDIREFYNLAEEKEKLLPENAESREGIIIKPEYIRSHPLTKIHLQDSFPVRVRNFVVKRPVVASFSSLGVLALFVISIARLNSLNDTNPHKYVINTEANTIEVFNAENDKLWNLILVNNFHTLHGNKDEYFNEYVRINDIDGDGANEVITTLCTEHDQTNNASAAQVFNHDGTLRYRKELGKEITYGSFQYPNAYTAKGLIARDFDGDGKSEIYIGLTHRNSPYSLVKLDHQGNETGRYWMYGHAFGIDTLLIQGRTYIALMGIDDTQEERKALLTILNPNEIHGEKRGTLFKGYNFSSSNAEEYVVNFPRTELEGALGVPKPRVTGIVHQNSEGFAVCVGIPYGETLLGIVDFHFSSDFYATQTKLIDGAVDLQKNLIEKGKIHISWDERFKESLKKQIQYWDGLKWRDNPVKVGVSIAGK
ncbi:MAG: hypothetical protein AB1728_07885 [Bacteroidota bacterium]